MHQLRSALSDRAFLTAMLDHLLDRAASWLRFSRLAARGLKVSLRYGDYTSDESRVALRPPSDDDTRLKTAGRDRLLRLYNRRLPLRYLGVELSPLVTPCHQPELFPDPIAERDRALAECKDAVRRRFGFMALTSGTALVIAQQVEHDRENFQLRTPCLTRCSGSPLPCTRGRGVGGEGFGSVSTPHPQPLSPEYRGEGSKWRQFLLCKPPRRTYTEAHGASYSRSRRRRDSTTRLAEFTTANRRGAGLGRTHPPRLHVRALLGISTPSRNAVRPHRRHAVADVVRLRRLPSCDARPPAPPDNAVQPARAGQASRLGAARAGHALRHLAGARVATAGSAARLSRGRRPRFRQRLSLAGAVERSAFEPDRRAARGAPLRARPLGDDRSRTSTRQPTTPATPSASRTCSLPTATNWRSVPLYITVDKDVLTPDDAVVNWDSGHLTRTRRGRWSRPSPQRRTVGWPASI